MNRNGIESKHKMKQLFEDKIVNISVEDIFDKKKLFWISGKVINVNDYDGILSIYVAEKNSIFNIAFKDIKQINILG